MRTRDAVIVCTTRTPIVKYRGEFAQLTIPELGAISLKSLFQKAKIDPNSVDELIFGNLNGSDWGNVARCSWLQANLPIEVSAITLDRQCGSALNAVGLASTLIKSGIYDVVVAGGAESYSQQPFYIKRPCRDYPDFIDVLPRKVAPLSYGSGSLAIDMIATADRLAKHYGITREECDEFALKSHRNASYAWCNRLFDEQVDPVEVEKKGHKKETVGIDTCVRFNVSMDKLASLEPVEKGGVTTAGNSSPRNDASSAILIMSREKAELMGLTPLACIKEYATSGVKPDIMGIGPVASTKKLMNKFGYSLKDFDLIELNEAFAAQSLAVIRELDLDPDSVNVEGGAIAIGHPTGASGSVLVSRLVYALKHRNLKRGLVTFCCGGGQGISLVIENE